MNYRVNIILLIVSITLTLSLPLQASEEAKLKAVQDAKQDFEPFKWIATGIGCTIFGCLTGGLTVAALDSSGGVDLMDIVVVSSMTGTTSACLPALVLSNSVPVHPLPDRLLGKSPEYINAYSMEYSSEIKGHRRTRLLTGTIITIGGFLGVTFIMNRN